MVIKRQPGLHIRAVFTLLMDHAKVWERRLSGKRSRSIPTGNQPAFSSSIPPMSVWVFRLKVHGERLVIAGQHGGQLLKKCLFHGQFLHFLVFWFGFVRVPLGCSYPSTDPRKKEIHISFELPYLLDMI